MEVTLPYLLDVVITIEDILGKVPRLRYVDHDVRDAAKFQDLDEDTYLINTGEVRPLDKPILEPTQWIMGLYKSGIMNLLDIAHFENGKNIRICVKHLVVYVHGGILWMENLV
jgi:hypothetical protein